MYHNLPLGSGLKNRRQYRQLCIIRLAILFKNQEVDVCHIGDDVEQMPQDEQTGFYVISREFEKLVNDRYIEAAPLPRDEKNKDPFLICPSYGSLPVYTRRLHSLMNLHEIPIKDIVKTFSPWNVKPRKSEEDSL